MAVTRRHLLRSSAASLTLPLLSACASPFASPSAEAGRTVFLHGVASGDPSQDSIVLWTRATPQQDGAPLTVGWTLYTDPQSQRPLRRGEVSTHGGRDYTVKVIVDGLDPGRTYNYRFFAAREASPPGPDPHPSGPGRRSPAHCLHLLFPLALRLLQRLRCYGAAQRPRPCAPSWRLHL